MDEETRSMASLIAFNSCFILGGIALILVEMGMVWTGSFFAILMAMDGSLAHSIAFDGWNRRLWDYFDEGVF